MRRSFNAKYTEIHVPSSAIANLYGFIASCKAADTIIVPPAFLRGHITHYMSGCGGLYGLHILEALLNGDRYRIEVDALERLTRSEKLKLITIGGSLNLFEHPVSDVRHVADAVGAFLCLTLHINAASLQEKSRPIRSMKVVIS